MRIRSIKEFWNENKIKMIYAVNDMAIKPTCDKCKQELTDFGGLLFSPPVGNTVEKYHLCKNCYEEIKRGF